MNYKGSIFAICLSLFLSIQGLLAQTAIETRIIERSFLVSGNMSLEVSNKYGKIHLSHTNSDSVNIRIELSASAPNQSKLRKLIDGVSFELNSSNYFIIAETRFEKGPANLFESVRSITNSIISTESRLQIDYYIEVPDAIDIKIDNRYGDIYIESLSCNLNIKMSNGNLKGEDLTGSNYFDLSFFSSSINSLTKARMNLGYGDLEVDYADDLNIKSSSSKIKIGSLTKLYCNSNRDKYFINELTELRGESYFTEFEIEKLYKRANFTTKYGSVSVDMLFAGFDLFSLYSNFTSIYLNIEGSSSHNLDIKVENCPTSMPGVWVIDEKIINDERKEYLYFGKAGSAETLSQIKLSCTRGKLVLNQY